MTIEAFARCVKQLGFYTLLIGIWSSQGFARCVKQLGFYTESKIMEVYVGLLGVLNN